MNRKFKILIDALYRVMPFDGDMQEYFDAFMAGRLPLYTESGESLNPYDYTGKTGRRLIRFQKPSQESYAVRLNGALKKRPATAGHSSGETHRGGLESRLTELENKFSRLCKRLNIPTNNL